MAWSSVTRSFVIVGALCIVLGACSEKEQAQQPNKALEEAKKDEALMKRPRARRTGIG
jgi:hypothetical protein